MIRVSSPRTLLIFMSIVSCSLIRYNYAAQAPVERDYQSVSGGANIFIPALDFQEKIQDVKKNFTRIYHDLMSDGAFDNVPHLKQIGTDQDDPIVNGALLLELIRCLEADKGASHQALLHACQRLFFLELHRFICEADSKHSHPPCQMLQLLHDIYKHSVVNATGHANYPFRSLVAVVAINILMVDASLAPYDAQGMWYTERIACLGYVLEKLRHAFIVQNKALGTHGISEQSIHDFINLLEIYGVKEPLVQARVLRKWIIFLTLAGVSGTAIGYVINKYGWVHIVNKLKNAARDLAGVVGEGFVDALEDRLSGRSARRDDPLSPNADAKEYPPEDDIPATDKAKKKKADKQPRKSVEERLGTALQNMAKPVLDDLEVRAARIGVRVMSPILDNVEQRAARMGPTFAKSLRSPCMQRAVRLSGVNLRRGAMMLRRAAEPTAEEQAADAAEEAAAEGHPAGPPAAALLGSAAPAGGIAPGADAAPTEDEGSHGAEADTAHRGTESTGSWLKPWTWNWRRRSG